MSKYKTNKVKCDIGSYIHYWRGIKKVGKTTLFYDLVQEQYGDLEKGLLIAVGDEIGYQALDGLVYAETPTWADIVEVVNDLVENKSDNNFEIVGIDTADEMIKLAKEEVKRIHKKQKGSSAEFNACLGGYGAPRDKVTELVDDILAKLRKAGYGIVIIGHTKLKDVKEKNGDEYQQLTSNLNADYDGIFANKADIVMTIAVEKNIDEAKRIKGTTRYMWFRTDGFVDAGGRFSEMPERIEYGAANYIEAFEEGVKKAIKGKSSDSEIKKRKTEEVKERKQKAQEYSENVKDNKIDTERNDELIDIIKTKFPDADDDTKQEVKNLMSKYDIPNFKDNDVSTKGLEEIVAIL